MCIPINTLYQIKFKKYWDKRDNWNTGRFWVALLLSVDFVLFYKLICAEYI
jgi:hypothetical protein